MSAAPFPPTFAQVSVGSPELQAQGIAAVVNEGVVTTNDLRERAAMILAFSGLPDDPRTKERVAPQVLRRLIDERLQMQEAERLGVGVTEEQIDRAVESLARENGMSVEQLERALRDAGASMAALRRQVRGELTWGQVVRGLARRVVVTDEQVDLALGAGRASAATEEVLLSELLLPIYDPDQGEEALNDARDLVEELRDGADFAQLARQFSVAATQEDGGDLGWVPVGALATQLKPVIEGLQPGQYSEPLRTPLGIFVFHVRERRTGEEPPEEFTEEQRQAQRRQLQEEQVQRLERRYMRDLRQDAFIDVRLGS